MVEEGTNVGYPDFIGNGVGDSLFLITVWEPVQVTLSTCSPRSVVGKGSILLRTTSYEFTWPTVSLPLAPQYPQPSSNLLT